jgi:hypothetical protein
MQALEPQILAAIALAEARLLVDTPSRGRGTEKCCMSDYLTQELLRQISTARESRPRGGKHKVIIPGVAVLRAKAVDSALDARNSPTDGHRQWLNGTLPDLPALPYVDLGYALDLATRKVARAYLIERGADGHAIAYVPLKLNNEGEGDASVVALPLPLPDLTPSIKLTPAAAEAVIEREAVSGADLGRQA